MPTQLTERVIKILTETQHLDPGRVTAESTFEELGIDSLDGINIVFALENEFGIDIPDDSLPELRSVQDIAAGIEKLLAGKGEG
ncbi:MAG: acyl carrier protein [Bryobacteraceae bacterium]|nr:acyl carrier protein [Bryobacteraceae bacterium]